MSLHFKIPTDFISSNETLNGSQLLQTHHILADGDRGQYESSSSLIVISLCCCLFIFAWGMANINHSGLCNDNVENYFSHVSRLGIILNYPNDN